MKRVLTIIMGAILISACSSDQQLQTIIDKVQADIDSLSTATNIAYWNGTVTGSETEFAKYAEGNMKITAIFSDKARFEELKAIKEKGNVKNPLLKRQLDILYNAFLANQADTALLNKIILKETVLEQKYASYRSTFKGEEVDDNRVEEILHESTDNRELEEIWTSHKNIGPLVADDIIEVVKLRNEVAKSIGFDNYHQMSLMLSEQDPEEITELFDQLDEMTRDNFAQLKAEMDDCFSKRYNLPVEKLMPWHYQGRYFQEAPNLYPVDLDKYYKGKNLEKLTLDFYNSIGLDVSSIMDVSDLYPKPGKNQHAFCSDMDRKGDVRVLCNCTDNESWMGTMLHEFGHGIYALCHDSAGNPYFLRDAAHTFTTEGVAMIFGRLSRNPEWMQKMVGISDEEKAEISENCVKSLRLQQLVFSRWVQVVYRFEKGMYENPDQDLNALWWDLVEEYQMLKRPEGRDMPDWATKIHIALYPCYYHNYQLGELFASQMHYYIINNITMSNDVNECYVGCGEVGAWMQEYVFNPGACIPWNEMIEKATGEKLTPKYYNEQFK